MSFSYADVLAGLLVVTLMGFLLLSAAHDYRRVHNHLEERSTAYSLMYEQMFNAPWHTARSTTKVQVVDEVAYTLTVSLTPGCSFYGADAVLLPNCASQFKEMTVTVEWKDHSITATRVSRALP